MAIFYEALAVIVLVGIMGLTYSRLIRPQRMELRGAQFLLLGVLLLTFAGGFFGSFFWWFGTAFWWAQDVRAFAWELPPLASRMLAAAGWSFAVGTFMTLRHPSPARVRLILLLLGTYLLPLIVIIPPFHLDRFDFALTITYGFFAFAGVLGIGAFWFLLRPAEPLVPARADRQPSPAIRRWLGIVGVLTSLWGAALFLTDSGPINGVWVWPGDLLTSRLIGVMLLTIGVGSFASRNSEELSRVMLAMMVTYGSGLALASLWNLLAGRPVRLAYVVVFGVIFLGSALLLIRRPATSGEQLRPA
jgi:hypothetical protein